MSLNQLRKQIDAIDLKLLRLLNCRATLAVRIGRLKRKEGLPVFDSQREEALLRRLVSKNRGPLPKASTRKIFHEILRLSRWLQTQ